MSARIIRQSVFGIRYGTFVGAAVAGMTVAVLVAAYGSRRSIHAGPMLQNVSTNSASILWWHKHADSGRVVLRLPDGNLREYPAHHDSFRFTAKLSDLQPSTVYRYWVENGHPGEDNPQIPGRFHTAPLADTPFSFLVFGDSGSGKRSQYRLAEVMNRHSADIILHTGDLVYRKGESHDYLKKFFRPYKHLLATSPFYPVLGNHDVRTDNGSPFLDTFCLPTNGPSGVQAERCYWFDYGNARFVGIDSTIDIQTMTNAVAPWLRQVLDSSSRKWKIVFFHHAPWAGGSRAPDLKIQESLVPIIEAGGADIVFCGHNHLYERTHPMRAGQVAPTNGVLYITSAAGGKSLHQEKHGSEPHIAFFNDTKFSFTMVTLNGPHLELTQISEDGLILDRVTVVARFDLGKEAKR